jgi:hypothetical protein
MNGPNLCFTLVIITNNICGLSSKGLILYIYLINSHKTDVCTISATTPTKWERRERKNSYRYRNSQDLMTCQCDAKNCKLNSYAHRL